MKNVLLIAVVVILIGVRVFFSERRREKKRLKMANLSIQSLDQMVSDEIRRSESRAGEIAQRFKLRYATLFEQKGYLLVCDFYRVLTKTGDKPTSDQTFEKDYASTLCLYIAKPGVKNQPVDTDNMYSNIIILEMYTTMFGRKRGYLTTLTPAEIESRVEQEIHRFADVLQIRLP